MLTLVHALAASAALLRAPPPRMCDSAAAGASGPAGAAGGPTRLGDGSTGPVAQFGGAFKVQKSERLLIREAWERADAYRPGKPNWFTQQQKDLVDLHKVIQHLKQTSEIG